MRAVFSIFPKFYQHLTLQALADTVKDVGLDTTNLVIRDGYWVTPGDLATQTPQFMKAMAAAGLEVRFATAGFEAAELIRDASPLAVLADNGITEFRMGYFQPTEDARADLTNARGQLEKLVRVCERCGVRAVYQVHQNTVLPNPSSAYSVVQGLPSQWLGVMIDPGNQAFEGYEHWGRSVRLLGDYCVAMGVKDVTYTRDPAAADGPDKGWKKRWAALDEGVTHWTEVLGALDAVHFDGTFVFMPFYDTNDPEAMTAKLKREVAYLRQRIAETGTD
jgi:sugar phosphate isomerase/epimerase